MSARKTPAKDPLKGAAVDISGMMDDAIVAMGDNFSQQALNIAFKVQLLDTGHLKPEKYKGLRVGARSHALRYYSSHRGRRNIGDKPYWSCFYHGTAAIARTFEAEPELAKRWGNLYEIGAGNGAATITGMLYGAKSGIATDIDPVAVAAIGHNAALNNVKIATRVADATDPIPDGVDTVLAADVIKTSFLSYKKIDQMRVNLNKFRRRGGRVVIADSYLRTNVQWLSDQQSCLPEPVRRYFDKDGSPETDLIVLGPI